MVAFLSLVSVACFALVAYIMSTAATIGFLEVLGIAIFGCVGLVAMIMLSIFMLARYTGHKVKNRVKDVRSWAKRLKK